MIRGWIVLNEDGSVVTEEDINWNKLDKSKIKILRLKRDEKMWEIRDKKEYVQFKSATQIIGQPSVLLSRCIGYKEEDGTEVIMRVDEFTGLMKLEVR